MRSPRAPARRTTRRSSPELVVATLAMCGIVVALQQTLMLPLLPNLPELIGTTPDSASWLVTSTLLMGAIATPTISRLADMYGKRKMMVVSLLISVAGSTVGALGEDLWLLIAARALQGVGMALIPVGIAIMRDELPADRVPGGVALMSATLAIGAGAGPPLSGLISQHLDWHAVFWVTGVGGAAMLLLVVMVLSESTVRTHGAFDIRGALLLSAALAASLLALSKGSHWGWSSTPTLAFAAVGLIAFAVWAPLELRTSRPLVDLRVAARRAVLLVNLASALAGFAMFSNMLITTQILQAPESSGYGLGLDPLHAGLWMVPTAAAFGVMAPVAAWLTRRVSPQATLLCGATVMCAAYLVRTLLSAGLSQVVVGSLAVGVGAALTYSAMPTLIIRAVPVTETASANGLNVLLRAFGTSAASALAAAVTSAWTASAVDQLVPSGRALELLIWAAAAAALATALVALPMQRMPDFAEAGDRIWTTRSGRPTQVVRGQVVDASDRPIAAAVITILTRLGEAVDWGQADSEGRFAAAIPERGEYVVVTTAEGWQPRSRIVFLDSAEPLPLIVLSHRLMLDGIVTTPSGEPVGDVLVILTRQSGEVVGSIRADHDGHYEMARPTNGRYVLTALDPDGALGARPVTVWEPVRSINLTLGTRL